LDINNIIASIVNNFIAVIAAIKQFIFREKK